MRKLTFVTREGCPLCDAGLRRVERWAGVLGYAVEEIYVGRPSGGSGDPADHRAGPGDGRADPADHEADSSRLGSDLTERYGDRVPVVLGRDGAVLASGRLKGLFAAMVRERFR